MRIFLGLWLGVGSLIAISWIAAALRGGMAPLELIGIACMPASGGLMLWGAIKLYRIAKRRGVIHAPDS